MKALEKFSDILYKIAGAITVAFMVFLTLLIVYSVISRQVFDKPVDWQYEATLVCLSWNIFIGMSMTFRKEEQMRLTFVITALKPKTRKIWLDVIDVLLIVFLIYTAILSFGTISTAWSTPYKTLPMLNRGMFYLPYPIGCFFSVVQLIYLILSRTEESVLTVEEKEKLAVSAEGGAA